MFIVAETNKHSEVESIERMIDATELMTWLLLNIELIGIYHPNDPDDMNVTHIAQTIVSDVVAESKGFVSNFEHSGGGYISITQLD